MGTYKPNSLKTDTREKRGSGARRRVEPTVKIPSNWKSFLRVDDNKTELFGLLAQELGSIDGDLLALDTKDIMPTEVVESIKNIKTIGQDQY